jgi:hypothetical protein
MTAIATSNLIVSAITMHTTHHYGAVGIGRLETLAPHLRAFDLIFPHLSTLHLHLRDWRTPDSGFALDTPRAPFVVRFLAKARNVRDLRVECYSSLEEDIMGEISRHCKFETLERCRLGFLRINNVQDLSAFLAPSYKSLRVLELKCVLLADINKTWRDLLRRLAGDMVCLEELEVEDLSTLNGTEVFLGLAHVSRRQGGWPEDVLPVRWRHVMRGNARSWPFSADVFPFLNQFPNVCWYH